MRKKFVGAAGEGKDESRGKDDRADMDGPAGKRVRVGTAAKKKKEGRNLRLRGTKGLKRSAPDASTPRKPADKKKENPRKNQAPFLPKKST